jgi:hypothetical protein
VDLYTVLSGTVIGVELSGKDSKTVSSDLGNPRLRVERSGYFRTAIRLPANDFIWFESISVRFYANEPATKDAGCRQTELKGLFILDQNYRPQPLSFVVQPRRDLRPGEVLVCEIGRKDQAFPIPVNRKSSLTPGLQFSDAFCGTFHSQIANKYYCGDSPVC